MADSHNGVCTGEPSLVIGTAGHIDHGKSALVRALTGTDPDRLEEEKRRGITIQLGFARLVLPSGRTMGVVDVPGHERFVRQMVAGATGIDLALLVVAADDGIMPQTVEHIAVLRLLGITSCVVAITKADLVDEEWLAFVREEVAARLANTPLHDAPIVAVSSKTGRGLDELRAAIDLTAERTVRSKRPTGARMPVDRAFTVKGFGTVATGTLWSGSVAPGDTLEILPRGATARVRSVQEHGLDCACAQAGNRVAVCLGSLSAEALHPGDFLARPGLIKPTDRFNARFEHLDPFGAGKPLPSGARVHVCHGTREVVGRVLSLEGLEELPCGSSTFVQVRLDEPLPLSYRDRFVVRSYSPTRVIAGGMVLDTRPPRRRALADSERACLEALDKGSPDAIVAAFVRAADLPLSREALAARTGLDVGEVDACLRGLTAGDASFVALQDGAAIAHRPLVEQLVDRLERELLAFHAAHPDKTALSRAALRQAVCPSLDVRLFDDLLARCPAACCTDAGVAHRGAGAEARRKRDALEEALVSILEEAGFQTPSVEELAQRSGAAEGPIRGALSHLEKTGALVRCSEDMLLDAGVFERAKAAVVGHLSAHGPATASELKDALATTRRYAMPLLEYLDAQGVTVRDGNLRRPGPAAGSGPGTIRQG